MFLLEPQVFGLKREAKMLKYCCCSKLPLVHNAFGACTGTFTQLSGSRKTETMCASMCKPVCDGNMYVNTYVLLKCLQQLFSSKPIRLKSNISCQSRRIINTSLDELKTRKKRRWEWGNIVINSGLFRFKNYTWTLTSWRLTSTGMQPPNRNMCKTDRHAPTHQVYN